jgi:hypothetical protein
LFFRQVRTPGPYLPPFSQAFKLILRKGHLRPWSKIRAQTGYALEEPEAISFILGSGGGL